MLNDAKSERITELERALQEREREIAEIRKLQAAFDVREVEYFDTENKLEAEIDTLRTANSSLREALRYLLGEFKRSGAKGGIAAIMATIARMALEEDAALSGQGGKP